MKNILKNIIIASIALGALNLSAAETKADLETSTEPSISQIIRIHADKAQEQAFNAILRNNQAMVEIRQSALITSGQLLRKLRESARH
jgi:hypothetical protein